MFPRQRPPKRPDRSFAGRWLGGFVFVGAIIAGVFAALADMGYIESAGIAALGATVGTVIGFRVAVFLVMLAEELGWDEQPPVSRIGRLYLRIDRLIDSAGL